MDHLEFADKVNSFGVSVFASNRENRPKRYELPIGLNGSAVAIVDGFNVRWEERQDYLEAKKELIKTAIDMDSWKHSWHKEVAPENYENFREIIQGKILDRAKDIDFLLTVYFQLQYELSKQKIPAANGEV